jgi:hypothetical protein
LRERKCSNLAFAAGFGEPGGEGGISMLGTGGRVRSWIRARDVEYGEEGPLGWSFGNCALSKGGGAGPDAGPRTGPLGGLLSGIGCCSCFCAFNSDSWAIVNAGQYGNAISKVLG